MQKHGLGRLPAWWQGGLILCALLWMAAPGGAAESTLKRPDEAMINVGDTSATVTTVTLAGTVVDAAARPVAGAEVLLACMTRSHVGLPQQVTEWAMALGPRAAYFSTRTDARGAFAFTLFRGEGLPYDGTPAWFRKPGRPGWGEYYVVVAPQGEDGGAIAGPLINDVAPMRLEELKADLRLVLRARRKTWRWRSC